MLHTGEAHQPSAGDEGEEESFIYTHTHTHTHVQEVPMLGTHTHAEVSTDNSLPPSTFSYTVFLPRRG